MIWVGVSRLAGLCWCGCGVVGGWVCGKYGVQMTGSVCVVCCECVGCEWGCGSVCVFCVECGWCSVCVTWVFLKSGLIGLRVACLLWDVVCSLVFGIYGMGVWKVGGGVVGC